MNDDLTPEELAQLEEEQKKKHAYGSPTGMLGALGAIGYFMYQNGTPEAQRSQLQKAWKREYIKKLTETHPELKKLNDTESAALTKYIDMMLVRGDSTLLQQTVPVTQLAHIHESIAQYAPEIANKLSPAILATSLSDISGPYAQQSKSVNARLGEKKLQELRTAELKAETRTRMRETIRSTVPTLTNSERERLFERLDAALEKHDINDVAQQISATYKEVPNQNEQLALSALSKALNQDSALTGTVKPATPSEQTPLELQRAAVFNRYAHDLEEKIVSSIHESGGGKDMLNPQRRTNESIAQYNNRIASARALRDDIARFSKLSTQSRRDALFTASTPDRERMGTMAAQRLLANFPQLKTLLSGALIYEHQNNLTASYSSEYNQAMQRLEHEPQTLTEIRAHEDSDLLTAQYESELIKTGQSPEAIATRKLAFKQAAQEELTADRTAKNLMQRVEKRLRTASGDSYRDDGFAFNRTFAWYTTQPELQQRLQEQPHAASAPSSTPLPRDMIDAVLKHINTPDVEETVTIRSSAPTAFPLQTKTSGVFDRGLNAGVRIADRLFSPRSMVKNAAQSALQKGARAAAQRAAVAAAENPATWPVIAVVIAIVVLGVIFFMLMDTNTMLAAAPYAKQNAVNTTTGTAPSPTLIQVPHAVTTIGPQLSPNPTTAASFPSLIPRGYGTAGQTWATMNPGYEEQTALPVQGYVTWYGRAGLMAEVATNQLAWGQITPCAECKGDISLMRQGDINRRVWIRRASGVVEGPYRVVDCAAKKDVATILKYKGWAADLSYEIAQNWGFKSEDVTIFDAPPTL